MFNFNKNQNEQANINKLRFIKNYNNQLKYNFLNNDLKNEINNNILKAKNIINTHLLPIIKNLNEPLEGNIFMLHETTEYTNEFFDKQVNFILAAKKENVKNILEIGFNAGFSTLLMLLSNENIKITCVDICIHSYTKQCFDKLKEIFGNRIELIPGSSTEILPTLLGNTYDLIHIDGCHLVNIAEQDIVNSLKLCKSGTILIMDDTQDNDLYNLWINYSKLYNLLNFYPNNFVNTKYHNIKVYP
jgi:predicted O-methyltransferase YrrM